MSSSVVKIKDRAAGAVGSSDLSEQANNGLKPSFQVAREVIDYVLNNGRLPDWFGPGQPIPPQAPPMLAGRQWDFRTATNTATQPRAGEGVSFATMRTLADTYDLLRLIIETRKDQVCKLRWSVMPRDTKKRPDSRCLAIESFLQYPDKEHNWDAWLRMILEDLLVLDAPAVYPRKTEGGELYSLEPIDGATIKRIIDDYGRTPLAPTPAYQQCIKGVPAFNFTRDELVYSPRNPRTNRLYGYSPVEWVIVTVNIALRRQAHQLQYYTEGSTPDLILAVPPDWTPKQIEQFQAMWNSQLAGQTDQTRGTRFVYNGIEAIDTKDKILKDAYDEWLARIVCFAFSMSPAPFVAQVNRATAESAQQQAKEEGIEPITQWVEDFVSRIIAQHMGAPDLCFKFLAEEEVNPEIRAKIDDMRLRNGSTTIDEVRSRNGEDPLPDGLGARPLIYTASGATTIERVLEPPASPPGLVPLDSGENDSGENDSGENDSGENDSGENDSGENDSGGAGDAEKVEKADRGAALRQALARALSACIPSFVEAAKPFLAEAEKAAGANKGRAGKIVANADLSPLEKALGPIKKALTPAHKQAMARALKNVGLPSGAPQFDLISDRGAMYAAQRAGELIGQNGLGGELAASTRDLIRGTITEALEEGWTIDQLSDELQNAYAFSRDRADTIADTELRAAVNQGELAGWKESGVVAGKQWLLSNDEGVCDICEMNAAEGTIQIDQSFSSGDDAPPGHPNCRCSMAPVVSDEE